MTRDALGVHPLNSGKPKRLNPLKRAIKIRSLTGNELLVRLTYERLPNYCYLCGCLGLIDKYCEVRFGEGFTTNDPDTQYGPWLRAPTPGRDELIVIRCGSNPDQQF
ncbi:hypothetical protein Sango_2509700 [Sesamum angolense]|uniref:Zinc knuckle CX2CX4HX4C domain-containing protein n=1 Tax=Sesamum angolense TaxID=2727404 RepID=A0AAE2BIB7_9LAMI|nr:hypothetical protein Sango_2509700 [Sesamum angolense]